MAARGFIRVECGVWSVELRCKSLRDLFETNHFTDSTAFIQ